MFDKAAVDFLGGRLAAVCLSFNTKNFSKTVATDLPALELKARAPHIADGIRQSLPGSYAAKLTLLRKAAGKPSAPDADTCGDGPQCTPDRCGHASDDDHH